MKEVQKHKWSAHEKITPIVLSLSVHSWLMNKAQLDSFSFIFENTGFASIFLRGVDELLTLSIDSRKTSVFNNCIIDYNIEDALNSIESAPSSSSLWSFFKNDED